MRVFQSSTLTPGECGLRGTEVKDWATEEEARAEVERVGSGYVVGFNVEPNLPGRLPAQVYRSFSLDTYHEGQWKSTNIFGG